MATILCMNKKLLLLATAFSFLNFGYSQFTKRVIFFKDKSETPFSLSTPSAYLSTRSIDRRIRYNISIDSTDLPIVSKYIDSVVASGAVVLLGKSKWLNAVIIQTSDNNALAKINSFPFVVLVQNAALKSAPTSIIDKFSPVTNLTTSIPFRSEQITADTFNYGASSNQIKIHKGEFLHNIGARGQGMLMAFLDGGFFGYLTNQFFDSTRNRNQIKGTWDFVNNNASVNEDNSHGMQCFSMVAAYKQGVFVGTSPDANYFLLRTEDVATEQPIEEYNWAMGAEYADSAGVDVISSSLGYNTYDNPIFDYTYADMNGNTTVVTRMADLAAKKGMLVVSSAGNSGSSAWKFITAPADGDSVLTLGSVNSAGIIAASSSFGPTSDGQIKPDIVSVGQNAVVSTTSGTVGNNSGTSFSCPNMAGLATCLWQLFPQYNNMKIVATLRQSADRFTLPHEQYGYGLPNMKKAVGILLGDVSIMTATANNCTTSINWSSKDISTMRYDIERKLPGEVTYTIIKSVAATGVIFSNQTYQYNDVITNSIAGNAVYRIKQVIDTSSLGFDAYAIDSAAVILLSACTTTGVFDLNNSVSKIKLFPNPASSTIGIQFLETESINNLSIILYNMKGQLVYEQNYNKPNGQTATQLSISHLQKGNYTISLSRNGKQYSVGTFTKQ